MHLKQKKYDGFSLLELVVVIAIIATLSLILVPSFGNYNKKAEVAKDKANARTLYTMASLIKEQNPGISSSELKEKIVSEINLRNTDNFVLTVTETGAISVTFNEQVYPESK